MATLFVPVLAPRECREGGEEVLAIAFVSETIFAVTKIIIRFAKPEVAPFALVPMITRIGVSLPFPG